MVYLKQKDYKREKMVLITGTVLIFITAIIGSQFMVMGKVYFEKVKFLETKGYELNGTLSWSDYDSWSQWINEKQELVWPPNLATAPFAYPAKPFNER